MAGSVKRVSVELGGARRLVEAVSSSRSNDVRAV
jgi:hypothetical protein